MSKNKIWQCQDGRNLPLRDMEEQHLLNTVLMLKRKQDMYDRTIGPAIDHGMSIPPLEVHGHSLAKWAMWMLEELDRRANKKIEKAAKTLGMQVYP